MRLHAHGELVAEVARGGLAQTGDAQVLAQRGGLFQIEIVERHDAVDLLCARDVTDASDHHIHLPLLVHVGHVEDFGDALGGPVGLVFETERGEQQHAAALPLALAHKLLPLLVTREAKDGQGAKAALSIHRDLRRLRPFYCPSPDLW